MTNPFFAWTLLVGLLLFGAGCGGSEATEEPQQISFGEAFIQVDSLVVTGTADRMVNSAFRPRFIGETLYLTDPQAHEILVVSPSGRLRTLGREGQGPGEFNLPYGVASVHPDTVFVNDRFNRRIQALDGEGTFRHAFSDPAQNEAMQAFRADDGSTVVRVAGYGTCKSEQKSGCVIRDFTPDGTLLRSFYTVDLGSVNMTSWTTHIAPDGTTCTARTFADTLRVFDAEGTQQSLFPLDSPSREGIDFESIPSGEIGKVMDTRSYTHLSELVCTEDRLYVQRVRKNMDGPSFVVDVYALPSGRLLAYGAATELILAGRNNGHLLFRSSVSDASEFGQATFYWMDFDRMRE